MVHNSKTEQFTLILTAFYFNKILVSFHRPSMLLQAKHLLHNTLARYPMFNSKKNNAGIKGISTRLHHKEIRNADKKKNSDFIQDLEIHRRLSLASPRGFLFRLHKDGGSRTQSQGTHAAIMLRGRRIPGQKDGEFYRSSPVCQDVSSVIRQSILQRRTPSLLTASKLKQLRIVGETTFLLKAQKNLQKDTPHRGTIPVNLEPRDERIDPLPPLAKHKAYEESQTENEFTELKDSSLSLDCKQLSPGKRNVSDTNKKGSKVSRETFGSMDQERYNSSCLVHLKNEETSSKSTQKKRTITVFLPVIPTDD